MKPIDQSKFGEQNGNCMSAVLASLLEIDLVAVPQSEDMDELKWYPALRRWLQGVGYHLLIWEDVEFYLPGYFIANGPSPRGAFEHSVIYKGTRMVHDPHPSRDGIEKITSIWALLPLDPVDYKGDR